ncbi:ATP-dependent zinc metalloprotease FTSH 12, chloroplastic [Vitis vinifera]|uniref:ATP-dependent zinc metalloprotease FTSH 12, chloroplastic n=1 Tax=Vitis vinifera TaxID=29760 RepID=A0A438G9D4_VITVI|nr:ATP-dependent zinc metalloprotease FTSH 12, chloroplastic [Vitis vinifera]
MLVMNLKLLINLQTVRKGHSKIYQQDIVDVLDKQLLEGMGVLLTEEEQQKCEESVSFEKKRLLAVHEAGHIVLAHLFPRFDWHAFSQLLPGGKETAISVFYPREDMLDQGYTTFGYMKMQMVVAHGGRCAERVVFGDEITDGGRDDLEKITKRDGNQPSKFKVGAYCLTKRVGLMDRPDSPDGELIKYRWDDPFVIPANMTLEVSELFSRELTRYIEETEEIAMSGLKVNRHILDMITNELLENSRITGLEVDEKMKGLSPIMFEDFVKPFQINLEEDAHVVKIQLGYRVAHLTPVSDSKCRFPFSFRNVMVINFYFLAILQEGPLPHNDRFGCPLSESKLDIDSGSWEKKETRLLTPMLWFLDAEAIEYCQLTLE